MKIMEKFILQSIVVALVSTQLAVFGLSMDKSASSSSSGAQDSFMGKIYRSAAVQTDNEKDNTALGQANRGARCVRCGANGGGGYSGYPSAYGGGGGYADRYYDRYYDDYYYRTGQQYNGYGREDPYYGGRDQAYYRDRNNWYYQPDYNRQTQGYYDRGYNRGYDERYPGRENQYYDDRYNANNVGYRGNGYDNLNPLYYETMRNQFRDRGNGYDQQYYADRFYDRGNRGYGAAATGGYYGGSQYYDNRGYRPYDETYSSTYGRPSLGSSYLFDRSDDEASPIASMNPPSANSVDKKQESANMEMKSK